MVEEKETVDVLVSRLQAGLLAGNDQCPSKTHRDFMRRHILDLVELFRRRIADGVSE